MTDVASDLAPAGWVIRADRSVLDVGPLLARFGLVHRYPIAPSAQAAAMRPGQPCVLFRTDRAGVVGIWAIGEVVGPSAPIPADFDHPATGRAGDLDEHGDQLYAELELLPLAKPISVDKLQADATLAASLMLADPPAANPVPLQRAELRAIEAMEFWIEEPSDEQRAALDAQLAAEDAAGL